eukprot:1159962-Pelagomonas_calceolata.AAC.7
MMRDFPPARHPRNGSSRGRSSPRTSKHASSNNKGRTPSAQATKAQAPNKAPATSTPRVSDTSVSSSLQTTSMPTYLSASQTPATNPQTTNTNAPHSICLATQLPGAKETSSYRPAHTAAGFRKLGASLAGNQSMQGLHSTAFAATTGDSSKEQQLPDQVGGPALVSYLLPLVLLSAVQLLQHTKASLKSTQQHQPATPYHAIKAR